VETPLSRKIIAGEIGQGDTITLQGAPDGLFFEVNSRPGAGTVLPPIDKTGSKLV
jgi:hypothetical protein